MIKENKESNRRDNLQGTQSEHNKIEIWEDVVTIKDLVITLLICLSTTFGGYLIAPSEGYQPLLFGLLGAVIGFIISSIVIKPKREFEIET